MANISKVYLLNTPLEDDMKNTLYFANASAQQSYMNNNIIKSYTNVSYQRDTSTFRCPAQIDTIRNCNYIMFQNTAYSNKWFYGFIKKMTYVNDNFTDVEFAVDPLQTFMFDITVRPSFIEREHTNDDGIGKNLVHEGVELGDYVEGAIGTETKFDLGSQGFVMGCTKIIDKLANYGDTHPNFVLISSIPDGLTYIGFDSLSDLKACVKMFNKEGHGDYINCIYCVPRACLSGSYTLYGDYNFKMYQNVTMKFYDSATLNTTNKLADNYQPRNLKLLNYPYRYVQMSNLNGSIANYHYEDFKSPSTGELGTYMHFTLQGCASVGCDIKVFPNNYKGIQDNYDEGLTYGKLPVGSWTSDAFTNWLTNNAVNISVGFISDIASIGVGVATAPEGGGMGIVSGVTGIANKIGQIYEHSQQPPQAEGATNVGNSMYSWGHSCMMFKHMSIRSQYAKIIDDFFDVFGYATHRVKVPNKAHRQNWWYTKTIDCNITGNVPNDYMNQIKGAYNNGITFWRNPSNFLNYGVSNGIV